MEREVLSSCYCHSVSVHFFFFFFEESFVNAIAEDNKSFFVVVFF